MSKPVKVKVTNIIWDISDSDVMDAFGSLYDQDGLPYTAGDFGLPPYDEVIEVDLDLDDDDDLGEAIVEALTEEYGFLISSGPYIISVD